MALVSSYSWRLVIPNCRARQELLRAAHVIPSSDHQGFYKTYGFLSIKYFWRNMLRHTKHTKKFVAACAICQTTKFSTHLRQGLYTPLPVPSGRWEQLTMDFVTGLEVIEDG